MNYIQSFNVYNALFITIFFHIKEKKQSKSLDNMPDIETFIVSISGNAISIKPICLVISIRLPLGIFFYNSVSKVWNCWFFTDFFQFEISHFY